MTLDEFVRDHCTGKQYDSCKNSPCRYASADGCRHPLHPRNATSERRKELLKELSNYRTVPGHGPDLSKMTEEQLELQLKLYKAMFEEAFKDSGKAGA